jgi:Holliday junction resolvase RusA-like endonuclease
VITVVLRGEPVGWQRTGLRVITPRGKKPFAVPYTPAQTRQYQAALALAAKVAARGRLLDGALKLTVTAFMGVPASWSKKKRDAALAGVVRPTGKPDFDNLAKQVDALKGIVWHDDAQVVDARVIKIYGEEPMLKIEVQAADGNGGLL